MHMFVWVVYARSENKDLLNLHRKLTMKTKATRMRQKYSGYKIVRLFNLFKSNIMKRPRTKKIRKTKGNDLFQSLPEDVLLNHIFHRLDFSSRIRARAVSRAWRDLSSHLPPIPWVCANNSGGLNVTPATAMAALPSPCIPVVHLRKPMLDVIGSNGQYVIANHQLSGGIVSLIYSPFTGKSFPLPRRSKFYGGDGSATIGLMNLPLRLAVMSSHPDSTEGKCVVAAIDIDSNLCVCRVGVDRHWISSSPKCYCVTDLLLHGRELCILGLHYSFKSTNVDQLFQHGGPHINFNATHKLIFPLEKRVDFKARIYLSNRHMVSSLGELLLVTIYRSISTKSKICSFKVHRMEREELFPIDDLGDRMLFVGKGCSMLWSGKEFNQLSSDQFFSSNCIYYVSWCDCHTYECGHGIRSVCPRDKVRVQRLWKLSLINRLVVGPIFISSVGSLMWMISPATRTTLELTPHSCA